MGSSYTIIIGGKGQIGAIGEGARGEIVNREPVDGADQKTTLEGTGKTVITGDAQIASIGKGSTGKITNG